MKELLQCLMLVVVCSTAAGQETSTVRYLANEGVMVVHGETKILFDPIFHYDPDTYQRLPQKMREAIMAGESPYDGVDGVFVSHYHPDHFSASGLIGAFCDVKYSNVTS